MSSAEASQDGRLSRREATDSRASRSVLVFAWRERVDVDNDDADDTVRRSNGGRKVGTSVVSTCFEHNEPAFGASFRPHVGLQLRQARKGAAQYLHLDEMRNAAE